MDFFSKLRSLGLGLSLCLIMPLAHADKFTTGLEFRTDFEMNSATDAGLTSGGKRADANDEMAAKKFNVNWARLVFRGEVNEKVSYLVKLNASGVFNSWSGDTFGTATPFSDASASYKVNDMLTLTMGKMYLLSGGFMGLRTPADNYHYVLTSNAILSESGARLGINHSDQMFFLSATNGGKELNQKTPMFGAVWLGKFMDGMVGTAFSYFSKPMGKQTGSPSGVADVDAKTNSYLNLAVQAHLMDEHLDVELHYGKNAYEKRTSSKDDTDSTIYGLLSYKQEGVKPFFLYETSKRQMAAADYLTRSAMSLGAEYYPIEKSNFRFHLVYTKVEDTFKAAVAATATTGARTVGQKVDSTQILLGLNFNI